MSDSEDGYPHQRFSDNPDFEKCCEIISRDLFELNGYLSTLNQFISALENNATQGKTNTKANENVNKKTLELIEKGKSLVSKVNKNIHNINAVGEVELDKTHLIRREKLTRDVRFSVQEFKKYHQQFLTLTKRINDMAKAALEESSSQMDETLREELEQHPTYQVVIEREPINNEELTYHQHLIAERDREISTIERGITELNGIFKDLGSLVQEQGQIVDNIEANLYNVADNTRMASSELNRAMRSGKSSDKLKLYFLLFLLFFLLLMIIVVFS